MPDITYQSFIRVGLVEPNPILAPTAILCVVNCVPVPVTVLPDTATVPVVWV